MISPNKSVVVVNDEPSILEMILEILQEEGYRVVACQAVERAHGVIKETAPDLAILDVRMPGGPDWHVLEAMRSDPSTAIVPVLICSASARELQESEVELRVRGCDLLHMPFDVDDLIQKVRQLTR